MLVTVQPALYFDALGFPAREAADRFGAWRLTWPLRPPDRVA